MNKIKHALTRKFGPLPAWAWLFVAGATYYFYRKYTAASSSNTSTTSTTGTGTSSDLSPIDIPPGDSVYDPNTGSLLTAPASGGVSGNGSSTTAGSSDPSQAIDDLATAITSAIDAIDTQNGNNSGSSGNGNGGNSGGGSSPNPSTPPGAAPPTKPPTPSLKGKGAIRAPFGHRKPTPPKGYRAVGLGHGFWEFAPDKKKAKPKSAHNYSKPPTTTTRNHALHTGKPRSSATTRQRNGGRTTARAAIATGSLAAAKSRTRGTVKPAAIKPAARPRTSAALVTTHNVQHIQASYPRPAARAPIRSAPRPSAPRPAPRRTATTSKKRK